jgi:hypothetical protein
MIDLPHTTMPDSGMVTQSLVLIQYVDSQDQEAGIYQ